MTDILRTARRVGIEGDDVEGGDIGVFTEAIQVQFQTELAQIDIFQFDGISHDCQQAMFGINGELRKLLLELGQFFIQVAQSGLGEYGWTAGLVLGFGCCLLQPMQVICNACVHLGGGGIPSAAAGTAACFGVLD
jgi:hypothetical protein